MSLQDIGRHIFILITWTAVQFRSYECVDVDSRGVEDFKTSFELLLKMFSQSCDNIAILCIQNVHNKFDRFFKDFFLS